MFGLVFAHLVFREFLPVQADPALLPSLASPALQHLQEDQLQNKKNIS
jgi:hypothetical protein